MSPLAPPDTAEGELQEGWGGWGCPRGAFLGTFSLKMEEGDEASRYVIVPVVTRH